jgi:hypothetical protein
MAQKGPLLGKASNFLPSSAAVSFWRMIIVHGFSKLFNTEKTALLENRRSLYWVAPNLIRTQCELSCRTYPLMLIHLAVFTLPSCFQFCVVKLEWMITNILAYDGCGGILTELKAWNSGHIYPQAKKRDAVLRIRNKENISVSFFLRHAYFRSHKNKVGNLIYQAC